MLTRRRFLQGAGVTLSGLVTTTSNHGVQPVMSTRRIPSSGEAIPVIGLGTWQTFDVGGDAGQRAECAATLAAFVAGGGRVIDSSPMYGTSESVVGDLLQAARLRDRTWLATKVWTSGEQAGVRQMRTSLERLRAPRIELMQIHNLLDWGVHLRTLRAWKEAGTIRYLGITHYQASAHEELERIVRREPIDVVQVNLSLDEPQAAQRLLGACSERGVAVIVNRPFGGGASFARARGTALPGWVTERGITSWAQYLLAWILSHPEVTCVIPGTRRVAHVQDNLAAGRLAPLDLRDRDRLARAWRA